MRPGSQGPCPSPDGQRGPGDQNRPPAVTLPTFFLVGAPKAGTTSLFAYLQQHPEVFMSAVKEPHYFSYAGERKPHWGVRTRAEYEALFAGADGARAVGEGSTWYLYSETAAEQIRRAVPEARILALLRNPVDRAYSSWAYRRQMGWEPLDRFEDAVAAEADRVAEGEPWDVHYVAAGRYARQVERYVEAFGRERVRVLLFEDLKADPAAVLADVFGFIGVDPSFEPGSLEAKNQTRLPRSVLLSKLLEGKGGLKARARGLVPAWARRPLGNALRGLNTAERRPLDPAFRAQLAATYRPDVEQLGRLLDRDLAGRWFS